MKHRHPLISVVLPVYNCQEFIRESIESILNQSMADFELLIIDDASTDNTLNIAREFKDPRIETIEKKKKTGLVDSLNLGFKLARGTYIARMDGDDISAPTRFEKQLRFLQNNSEIKAVGSWLEYFGEEKKVVRHSQYHSEIQADLLKGNSISMGTAMLVRKAYVPFDFSNEKVHVEDYDFWARSAWACRVHNLQEVLYFYRVHKNQVSNQYIEIQNNAQITIKLHLFKKVKYDEKKFPDEVVSKIWQKHLPVEGGDAKKIFRWLSIIVKKNSSISAFDQKELVRVIKEIRRRFLFELFFIPGRSFLDFFDKWEIIRLVPWKDKIFLLKKKFWEKVKIIFFSR